MKTLAFVVAFSVVGCGSGSAEEPATQSGGTGGAAGARAIDSGSGGTAGAPAKACPEGYPMGETSGKPVIDVLIQGKGPYSFVYDTGAPYSGMDVTLYPEVGAGPYTLDIGGKNIEVPLLQTVPTEAVGITGVKGIIGKDVMGAFAVTLDFARSRFWLDTERDESALLGCAHASGDPVDVAYQEGYYFFVPGKIDSASGWLLLDSGASLGGVPESVFDQVNAVAPRPALEGFYTPAAIGTFWSRLASIGRMEVAGRAVEHITIRTLPDGVIQTEPAELDGPFLGLVPTDFLKHFLVTLDQPNDTLRLDAYLDLDPHEPTRFFSVGIGLEKVTDPPVHVAQVLAKSAAEEAGVEVGDEVIAIQGHPIETLSTYQRPWGLLAPTQGEEISMQVLRAGQTLSFSLEARDLLTDP